MNNENEIRGKYFIQNQIGAGGFSRIYLVTDRSGSRYALKQIDRAIADENDLARKKREVDVLVKREHPYVINYFETFVQNLHYYIVMEYCSGGDMRNYLNELRTSNNVIPQDRLLEWCRQLLVALRYLHSQQIIHRDLKPANILMADENKKILKIADFGLSIELNKTNDRASTNCGTYHYLAPEIFNGPYGIQIDVWSMGCVIYEMLKLEKAFGNNLRQEEEIKNEILNGPIPQLDEQHVLRQLIQNMLQRDPRTRWTASDSFDEIKRIIGGQTSNQN